MRATIWDTEALFSIPPAALSAYARGLGWTKAESYGDHSDVYTADRLPDIILPRSQRLADYPAVVSRLIGYFSDTTETNELSVYRDLITADRDVVRVRAPDDLNSGSLAVNDSIRLLGGAREMILAAACSLRSPQPYYRAGANKEASEYLSRVNLGQTEQGSFILTLLSPSVSPPLQETLFGSKLLMNEPFERQVTRRLVDALAAARDATERTAAGDSDAFSEAIPRGVSANLCEALEYLIDPFPTLDISISWARTYPMPKARDIVRFGPADAPILKEAARIFRAREPKPDTRLFGIVWRLTRHERETAGTITLHASVDESVQSVTAVLRQSDYDRAIEAHQTKSPVIASGDLERVGERWHLQNPRIESVIFREEDPDAGA